ncbi:universal stress protein UspA [Mycobacterium heckeshornense]|uniref:Universal stress protein n=1 Tax=Mycobacterium heckeshornense TaxID=110505 RepID=A0A2G8AV61_9MYCO|nr:universal stress protein [Mycobacterium heckeshornense]KMV15090.1 hypothetical protein ACT16_23085 [Mycobacterium heckeshornense]MCV7034687.1 universal stress protein [Mycobacterium heckeshornense]PIJ29401.1 universal stress protein UspA [Mycobacterium heckeshornense]BCO34936.1 universal stress protein [Mycobacterium heckeshornense]BCQ08101.1 universal stress protein [Mycobacterium heckeshornense]
MGETGPAQSVVVGIDGSASAQFAAVWAADEAASRDIPLRLVYAVALENTDRPESTREFADARLALRRAVAAVESTGKPVKVETEIAQARPIVALLNSSRSAAMTCVGSARLEQHARSPIGSIGSALIAAARCPVAVVYKRAHSTPPRRGLILAVVEGPAVGSTTLGSAVLEMALQEAQLRNGPLRVLTVWPPHRADAYDLGGAAFENWAAQAQIDSVLSRWRRSHPQLDLQSAETHGSLPNYLEFLARNATPIQLVVVDPRQPNVTGSLLAASGRALLDAAACSVLSCGRE